MRSENRPPRVEFTFGIQNRFLAKNSCAEQPLRVSDRQPGQSELLPGLDRAPGPAYITAPLHTEEFGTLYPANVHGLPRFLPSLPKGPDSDHGPIITTPLTRYSEENRPVEIERELLAGTADRVVDSGAVRGSNRACGRNDSNVPAQSGPQPVERQNPA